MNKRIKKKKRLIPQIHKKYFNEYDGTLFTGKPLNKKFIENEIVYTFISDDELWREPHFHLVTKSGKMISSISLISPRYIKTHSDESEIQLTDEQKQILCDLLNSTYLYDNTEIKFWDRLVICWNAFDYCTDNFIKVRNKEMPNYMELPE